MATTVTISSKSATTISGSTTKTVSNTVYTDIGPGTNYVDIASNRVGHAAHSGSAGTYSWSFSSGLTANTQYGVVAYAVGGGDSEVSSVVDGTLPPPSLTSQNASNITHEEATINFTTANDGGYYPKTIQYSLDGESTWNTGTTISSGTATTSSFLITGLSPETQYTVALRATTTAGSSATTTLSFTTAETPKVIKTYGSVSGSAVLLTDFYGSSNNQAQKITKLYGSVEELDTMISAIGTPVPPVVSNYLRVEGFDSDEFFDKISTSFPSFLSYSYCNAKMFRVKITVSSIESTASGNELHYDMYIQFGEANNIVQDTKVESDVKYRILTAYGVDRMVYNVNTAVGDTCYVNIAASYTTAIRAKLIHQGFGHLDYT